MTAREKKELMEAYNHLVEGAENPHEIEFFGIKKEYAPISARDYEVLKPFIFAWQEHTYWIGKAKISVNRNSMLGGVAFTEDGDALVEIGDQFDWYELHRAVELVLKSKVTRKEIDTERRWEDELK